MSSFLRAGRALALVLPASVALHGASCGPAETQAPPGEPIGDVIYGGVATDEALQQLLAATPKQVAGKGAVLDTPADGMVVPASAPPSFTWHVGGTASLEIRGRARSRGWVAPLAELVGPPRPAHAHGDPVNGAAYLLVLSTASSDELVRVFTTETSYTPDAATWATMKGAGGAITASVLTAIFDNNQVASDGGPFEGTPITFTVGP